MTLQMRLDPTMAALNRVVWGTQLEINGLSSWSDEKIVNLAMTAHEEMLVEHKDFTFRTTFPAMPKIVWKRPPLVTTALIVGDVAYISTSQKGIPFFYLPPAQRNRFRHLNPRHPCATYIKTALESLQLQSVGRWGHRLGAACGEIWASQGHQCSSNSPLQHGKAVSVRRIAAERSVNIIPPCGDGHRVEYDGEWGCTQFAEEIGLYIVPENTPRSQEPINTANMVTRQLHFAVLQLPPRARSEPLASETDVAQIPRRRRHSF